jgi:hypothetical protein
MGQPRWSHVQRSPTESIGRMRQTEGSEPSQYLEEEKTIVIPSVAASERGRAQTGRASVRPGLWGLATWSYKPAA